MANPRLQEIPTEKLQKRRKTALIILIIIAVVVVLSLGLLVFDFISEGSAQWTLLIPVLGCIAAGLPMLKGVRDIDSELEQREK